MMFEIKYAKVAADAIERLKKTSPIYYKKVRKIIDELGEHPRIGTGHPEQLKGLGGNIYSRHFSKKDRIIYEIHDEIVLVTVLQVGGHYDDK